MSLLNDVLKDIDSRQTSNPDIGMLQDYANATPVNVDQRRRKILQVLMGGALVLGLIGAVWWMLGDRKTPVVGTQQIDQAAVTTSDKEGGATAEAPMIQKRGDPESVVALAQSGGDEVQTEVKPVAVPRISARSTIEKATQSPPVAAASLPSVELESGNGSVTVNPVAMVPQITSSYTAPIEKPASSPSVARTVQQAPRPSPVRASRAAPTRNIATGSPRSLPRTYNNSDAINKARIRALYERDVAARAVAQEAMQVGDFERAEYGLRQFLTANPEAELSRSTLASLLLQRGRGEEAERILIGGFGHDQEGLDRVKLLARAQVERGDLDSAIRVLDANPVPIEQDAEYHALKAAIYQRAGRHAVAARTYQNLLREYPPQAAWWVGLGISLEATARRKDAIHAYRQARDFHAAPKALKSYSAQRILALAR